MAINLKTLAEASALSSSNARNHSILIYGDAKTGKTRFVGTVAKIPEIKRVFWVDLENGIETLLHMDLAPAELEKIIPICIPDTREVPRGIETVLKMFSSKTPISICQEHGTVNCQLCSKAGLEAIPFCLKDCTSSDLIVIDSGSQLGDSALAFACAGRDITFKPTFDEWGAQGKYLGDIMGVIQAAHFTNFVVITHSLVVEEVINGIKTDKVYPLIGTRAFSQKVGKYFGTVIYMEKKLGKHAAGSSSLYKTNTLTGSRLNIAIEKSKELDMRSILVEGGIIKC